MTRESETTAVCGCRVRVRLVNYEESHALSWPWVNRLEITEECGKHKGASNPKVGE